MKRRGEQPWKVNRARVLRSNQTRAEDLLWSELRAKRFMGLKFVRQLPVGPYFADFVCRENGIVVEVDGGTHSTEDELRADAQRSEYLKARGYRVFRVHNTELYESMDGVLETLLAFIEGKLPNDIGAAPLPNPLPR